jgi:hypothetical protein
LQLAQKGVFYRFSTCISQCTNAQIPLKMALALGLGMVKMDTLSCGATGTRPQGVP